MSDHTADAESVDLDSIGHPKGTLAVLALYMLLFVLGWLGLYFLAFIPRGTPDSLVDPAGLEAPRAAAVEAPTPADPSEEGPTP